MCSIHWEEYMKRWIGERSWKHPRTLVSPQATGEDGVLFSSALSYPNPSQPHKSFLHPRSFLIPTSFLGIVPSFCRPINEVSHAS